MRVAMVCHNYLPHPGGLEVIVRNLARHLAREHRVALITTAWDGVQGVASEDGVEVHRLPAFHFTERWSVPYPIPKGPGLAAAIRTLAGADVLHAHGSLYLTSAMAAAVSRMKKIPLVVTEHVGFVSYASAATNAVQRIAWRLMGSPVLRTSSAVTTYNERVAAWLRERFPRRPPPHNIPNGVDASRFRRSTDEERRRNRAAFGLPQEVPLLLFAGRHSVKKNLDFVLRIPRPSFHLVVCGDRRDLRGDRVIDLGLLPHDEMPRLYGCADLLVHAATGEGFPLVVQEALSSGLPAAVLWDPGYAASIDRDAVAACDSLDDLAGEVLALIANPHRRAELSRRGLEHARKRWSWEATARSYARLYRGALPPRPTLAGIAA